MNECVKTAPGASARGADVTVYTWDWGITGLFRDPDANRVELEDAFAS